MALKLAVTAAAFDADIRLASAAARRAGFSGLQINAFSPGLDVTTLSGSGRREFISILRASDLQLVGLTVDLGRKGFGPGADLDAVLDRLDKVLQSAAEFASPLVCLDLGPLPAAPAEEKPALKISPQEAGIIIIPTPTPQPVVPERVSPPDPKFVSMLDGAMAELARKADRYGVMVALRSELAGFASQHRAMIAAACPWFGVDLDPVAMLQDEWPRDEFFSRLGGSIRHVRGRDAVVGTDHRTKSTIVGCGCVEWPGLLKLLDDAGYRNWITLDPMDLTDRKSAALSGAKNLTPLLL